jgi:hypothetical protein
MQTVLFQGLDPTDTEELLEVLSELFVLEGRAELDTFNL